MIFWLNQFLAATILSTVTVTPAGKTVINPTPWWYVILSNGLALTIIFIFLAAIISILLTQRRRDKCLKFFHHYPITYLTTTGQSTWGRLKVYSKGIELFFKKPHITNDGFTKGIALIYEKDMATAFALCRTTENLSDKEQKLRRRQIHKTFHPGMARRMLRWFRNIMSTFKDAFNKSLTAIIGTLSKSPDIGSTVSGQKSQVQDIGQNVLGAVGNAYEPILESHIGQQVILDIISATDPTNKLTQIEGYLADYTSAYIAVFNTTHAPKQDLNIAITGNHEQDNIKIEMAGEDVTITCTGPDILIIKELQAGELIPPPQAEPDSESTDTKTHQTPDSEPSGMITNNIETEEAALLEPLIAATSDALAPKADSPDKPETDSGAVDDPGQPTQESTDLQVALLNGCTFTTRWNWRYTLHLSVEKTRNIDIVAPRAAAIIHFSAGKNRLNY